MPDSEVPTTNAADPLFRHAELRPGALAQRTPARAWTFGRLVAVVEALRERLRGHAVRPGDRVLLVFPTDPEFVVAYLAVLAHGAVTVTANPQRTRHELDYFIADSGARMCLAGRTGTGPARSAAESSGIALELLDAIPEASGVQRVASFSERRPPDFAGSADKVAALPDLGYDVGFDYHDGPVSELIGRAAPDGIDVYFDNVGGDHLEAAIAHARLHARFAICGAVSNYNLESPPAAPRNLNQLIARRLSLLGFLVFDFVDRRAEFLAEVGPLVASGKFRYEETITNGLDAAPQAFLDMLAGHKTGKALVRLAD